MGRERDKIIAVTKYLSHKDRNARAKALKKLEDYLGRGYNRKLILKQLKHYITTEKEIKHVNYAKDLIGRYKYKTVGSGTKIQITQKMFFVIIVGLILLIGILFLIPSSENMGDLPKGVFTSKKVKKSRSNDVREHFSLNKAIGLKLRPSKKFKVTPFKKKVIIKFKPKNKSIYRSSIKVIQQTNSNGRRIARKSLSFLLTKKTLRKKKSTTDILVKVSNPSGSVSPSLMGFPPPGKALIFEIDRSFTVKKVKHVKQKRVESANVYLFPFPLFSKSSIRSGMTWGTDISGEKFGVKSKYKFEGYSRYKNKTLYKISFVSVSRSNYKKTVFTVSRKGVFYINSSSGVSEYLKLYTVSETRLKGSGFPVENIVIVEESLI